MGEVVRAMRGWPHGELAPACVEDGEARRERRELLRRSPVSAMTAGAWGQVWCPWWWSRWRLVAVRTLLVVVSGLLKRYPVVLRRLVAVTVVVWRGTVGIRRVF